MNADSVENDNYFRILVLGGMGFIGSHLCRVLLGKGYSVRIFDKLYGSRKVVDNAICYVDSLKEEKIIAALLKLVRGERYRVRLKSIATNQARKYFRNKFTAKVL